METRKRIRLQVVGIAIGVLTALLIWPSTRWLVLAQMGSLVPGRSFTSARSAELAGISVTDTAKMTHRVAARMPEDYVVQLAAAVTPDGVNPIDTAKKLENLRALVQRFPDQPSLYANILRMATLGAVIVHREEELLVARDGQDRINSQPASQRFDSACGF